MSRGSGTAWRASGAPVSWWSRGALRASGGGAITGIRSCRPNNVCWWFFFWVRYNLGSALPLPSPTWSSSSRGLPFITNCRGRGWRCGCCCCCCGRRGGCGGSCCSSRGTGSCGSGGCGCGGGGWFCVIVRVIGFKGCLSYYSVGCFVRRRVVCDGNFISSPIGIIVILVSVLCVVLVIIISAVVVVFLRLGFGVRLGCCPWRCR